MNRRIPLRIFPLRIYLSHLSKVDSDAMAPNQKKALADTPNGNTARLNLGIPAIPTILVKGSQSPPDSFSGMEVLAGMTGNARMLIIQLFASKVSLSAVPFSISCSFLFHRLFIPLGDFPGGSNAVGSKSCSMLSRFGLHGAFRSQPIEELFCAWTQPRQLHPPFGRHKVSWSELCEGGHLGLPPLVFGFLE